MISAPRQEAEAVSTATSHQTTIVLLLTALSTALRLPRIAAEGIWRDESATWTQINGSLFDVFVRTAADTYPPAYNLLAWVSVRLLGFNELGLRLPATILGILAVPAIYWVSTLLAGRRAALIAVTLFCLSPYAIHYSVEARPYSLLLLASAINLGAVLSYLKTEHSRWLVLVSLSGTVVLYTHPFGTLGQLSLVAVMGCLAAFTARRRGVYLKLLLAAGLALLSFSPWAVILVNISGRLVQSGFWIRRPGVSDLLRYWTMINGGAILTIVNVVLLGFASAALLSRKTVRAVALAERADLVWLPFALAATFGPTVIGFVLSQFTTPILLHRYMVGTLPGLYGLAALGAGWIVTTPRRSIIALTMALVLGAMAVWLEPVNNGEDWRGLGRDLPLLADARTCIVGWGQGLRTLSFYFPLEGRCSAATLDPVEIAGLTRTSQKIIVVLSHARGDESAMRDALPATWTVERRGYAGVHILVAIEGSGTATAP